MPLQRAWPRPTLRMAKVAPVGSDVAAAVAGLADELLHGAPTSGSNLAALDRLRRRLLADEAVVWSCSGARATRVLYAGTAAADPPGPLLDLEDVAPTIHRLRMSGTLLRRAGEVSGLEPLVSAGMGALVAAATIGGDDVTGVLALGWAGAAPACGAADLMPLRIAAALLGGASATPAAAGAWPATSDTILGSLADPTALVDRDGIIVAVNAAWTESAQRHGNIPGAGLAAGASYPDAWRAAAASTPEAAAVLEGIEGVCAGTLARFDSAYVSPVLGRERVTVVTVTPLRQAAGGAIVAHTELTQRRAAELGDRLGHSRLQQLADGLPLPVLIVSCDGRVLYANQGWWDATGERATGASPDVRWTNRMDAATSVAAAAALRAAARDGARMRVDLRLKGLDGRYRWWTFTGDPRRAADGQIESYIGCCSDITATMRARSTLAHLATKLVTAQEAERARIARDLHDDLGQQIALLAARLELLGSAPTLDRALDDARQSLQQIATTVSSLSHQLHPSRIRLLGLALTLEGLCRDVARESGVRVVFQARRVPPGLTEDTAVCLFRIAQEALHNAIKHSAARRVGVRLVGMPSQLTLRIVDDGVGFDPMLSQSVGLGLLTMRERAELVGGAMEIDTARTRGTSIRVTVPVPDSVAPRQDTVREHAGRDRYDAASDRAAKTTGANGCGPRLPPRLSRRQRRGDDRIR